LKRLVAKDSSFRPFEKELKKCIGLRNTIIHDLKFDRVSELLNILQNSTGIDFSKKENRIDNEEYRFLRKKVSGFAPIEPFPRTFDGFKETDFRNLCTLQERIIFLRGAIADFCLNELNVPLYFDDVSEVVNNSAWVWLAAVTTLEKGRPKIELPSISILATNNDVRVYLEFGGRCKFEREKYYELLLTKGLDDELSNLKDGYSFFDIYWYFNIENIHSIQSFIERRDLGKIAYNKDLVRENVDLYKKEIRKNLTLQNNKYLVGKVFSRTQVVEMGVAFVDEVKDVFSRLQPLLIKIQSDN
jgi:hypothetical protein